MDTSPPAPSPSIGERLTERPKFSETNSGAKLNKTAKAETKKRKMITMSIQKAKSETANPYAEPKPLDPEQAKVQANASESERGTRSDAYNRAQQNLDQYLMEFQTAADNATKKGGLTTIDVQCDSIDDEPIIGLEGWGSYKIHEPANVSFLRAWREHTRGKPENSGSIEFLAQEDRIMWHFADIPVSGPDEDGRRKVEPALIRWSFDDQRYEYDLNGEVSTWPDFDETGKPHRNAGDAVRMWRIQEIRKIRNDAVAPLTSQLLDVRRAQSKVRKERNADFSERSVDRPGETADVSF